MAKRRFSIRYKKVVLEYAELCGSDAKSYREFEVSKSTFYQWRQAYKKEGEAGLAKSGSIIIPSGI
jgi:transposase